MGAKVSTCIGTTSEPADWTNLPLELLGHLAKKLIGILGYNSFYNASQRKTKKAADQTSNNPSDFLQHVTKKLTATIYILFRNVNPVDWTNLPPELLQLIAGKLTHISDYIGFRSVCTSWRSAACPTYLPPQLPWLVLPYRGKNGCTLTFFSPSNCRVYNFSFPEINLRKSIYGSSYGWLVMVDKDSLRPAVSLLNPITRAQIVLPPLPEKQYIFSKALLCFNPSMISLQPLQQQQLMVVIWSDVKLFIFRHGDENWGEIQAPCNTLSGSMVFFEKRAHVVDGYGKLAIINLVSLTLRPLIEELEELSDSSYKFTQFAHLVEATGNLLLIAWKPYSWIHFYRLDRRTGKLKWARIANEIEDTTILTSLMQSVAVPKQDFLGDGSENQIYLFGDELFHTRATWDGSATSVRSTTMAMPDFCNKLVTSWTVPSLH